jgi:asparagine synthase (glutamine-hydrolysing)
MPPDGAGATRFGNEWDLARTTTALAGTNVRHIAVDAAHYGVVAGIKHFLKVHDGPSHAAANHFWIQAITEMAAENGAKVLLTGQMGNGTVSWTGNSSALLALLQRKHHIAWQLFIHTKKNRIKKHGKAIGDILCHADSALNVKMAELLDLKRRMDRAGYDRTLTVSPLRDHRLVFFGPAWSVAAGLWSEIGAMHSLSVRDPTANLALIEFLLRVPDDQFRRAGQGSSLYRRTLSGRLPQAVLAGGTKGLQAADLGHRILQELPAVRKHLDDLDANPVAREVLDLPNMRRCLEELVKKVDPTTTTNAGNILLRGVGVGLFLLSLD